jgi:hypothetical protein
MTHVFLYQIILLSLLMTHPALHVDFKFFDCQPTFLTPNQGDYLFLYNTLCNCNLSRVLNENSVNSIVYNFT